MKGLGRDQASQERFPTRNNGRESRFSRALPDVEKSSRSITELVPLITLPEVAAYLQLSEKTIRRLVAAQRIPCVRIGRQLRFVPSDVLRWLSAQRKEG